jgi:hypothetical protein
VRKSLVSLFVIASALGACGGAGSGGAAAPVTSSPPSAAPIVAGTQEPKPYPGGKTADPNASPDYYGY